MNNDAPITQWLLEGDVSIQYQVSRDLLNNDRKELQNQIASEGWGAQFLSRRHPNKHWGLKYYQPKWISTHYTLLDLRNLCIDPENDMCQETVNMVLEEEKGADGGLLPIGEIKVSDVCLNGMALNFASYFRAAEGQLKSIIDFMLSQRMPDGGFNCMKNRSGAVHSSLHSTLSVLEGLTEYQKNGNSYRIDEVDSVCRSGLEFILKHQLFLSDRTGKVIKPGFLKLCYPCRWYYDILKALDYFQYANIPWDDRMQPAIDILLKKRKKDGTWNVQAHHPGQMHFQMESAGKPSRWNTLRALRVLKYYGIGD